MKSAHLIFAATSGIALLAADGAGATFLFWRDLPALFTAGNAEGCSNPSENVEVVFTGSTARLWKGLTDRRHGTAAVFHISGINRPLHHVHPLTFQGMSADTAPNTNHNARETVAWLRAEKHPHLCGIRLVTSPEHMVRSLLNLSRELQRSEFHDVRVIPAPSQEDANYKLRILEMFKTVATYAGYAENPWRDYTALKAYPNRKVAVNMALVPR